MRILVVGINYAPDLIGVAKYNTELCEALVSFGHEVRVVTAPPYYPEWNIPDTYRGLLYRSETINGVSIRRSPIYVPEYADRRQAPDPSRLIRTDEFMACRIRRASLAPRRRLFGRTIADVGGVFGLDRPSDWCSLMASSAGFRSRRRIRSWAPGQPASESSDDRRRTKNPADRSTASRRYRRRC